MLDKKLLSLLACPLCKGSLHYQKQSDQRDPSIGHDELWCKVDQLAFPVRDGIPVMLEDEARKLSLDEATQRR